MSASISLTHSIATSGYGAVKLHLKTTGTGMPSEVFAIEVMPTSADPTARHLRFSHICSPSEFVTFPPAEDSSMTYFRTDDIELVFDTVNFIEPVMTNIRKDIRRLVDAYNELNNAEPSESTEIF